ncbi:amino acid ABC transporter permease [Tenuibacillus multivorans]|uniref:Polar amino acid transport system permease protein n=1 Tax=Tenuibacillus multivorans TaxID=237069 RepID=A0A1H0B544_9BACI|nr:amino acid ABC transporter permease [Tenuibacillus multivorans]GEL77535.1 arginine ABC transporter permease [Tenuibacillus multivorans]SDN40443.1 polar amino acid transport system permease protein [Tenuibacillus multivorans]
MNLDFSQIVPYIPFMLEGIWVTLGFVIIAIVIGFFIGSFIALVKISHIKVLRWIADFYTSVFRGTPLILQLMFVYYAVPQVLGYDISPFLSAILTFGLNSSAYVSEIIRAGIEAVDKGQREAAMALGIPYRPMMIKIILPQAMKNILPALMNEFITLTKESAIVSVINYLDLMRRAQVVGAELYRNFEAYIFVGAIYYVMVMMLTVLGKLLERRLKKSD